MSTVAELLTPGGEWTGRDYPHNKAQDRLRWAWFRIGAFFVPTYGLAVHGPCREDGRL